MTNTHSTACPSLSELIKDFTKIGFLSFGGAPGQIAMMHKLVVDENGWLSEKDYLDGLNFCMLLPGPEAQQLATYIGWRLHGAWGGLAAGMLFVIPGALIMFALAFIYVLGSGLPMIEGILFGIKAAVLAIIVQAVIKIGKRGLKSPWLYGLAFAGFLGLVALRLPFPVLIIGAAILGALFARSSIKAVPFVQKTPWRESIRLGIPCLIGWWLPIALVALVFGQDHFLVEIGLFFSKLAVITFGGAYAVLAYLTDEAVLRGWVNLRQMIDGLGLSETTPGPTILVNQFIAFLAGWSKGGAGLALAAGAMAVWATFAPSFLWIFAGAPHLDALQQRPVIVAALRGISAAVVGVVAYVGYTFALAYMFTRSVHYESGLLSWQSPDLSSMDGRAVALTGLGFLLVFVWHWSVVRLVLIFALLGLGLSALPGM